MREGDSVDEALGEAATQDAESPPRRARRRHGAVPAGLLGALTGVVVVAVLIATGHLVTTVRFGDEDASDAFVQAWTRSRSSSFVVDSSWQRQLDDGATLDASEQLVQAPGRRIVRQFSGISGEIDGRSVDCYTMPGADFQCAPTQPTGQTFDQSVAQEAQNVRDAISSPGGPRYRVRTDDHGCFELTQTRAYPDPTYGRSAILCFDPDTGALRSSERHFDHVVERIRATGIRTQIQPSDFDLTASDDYDIDSGGGSLGSYTVGPDSPSSAPADSTSTSSTAVRVTGDPCQPGPTYDASHCADPDLLAACIANGGDIVSVGEAFKRNISFNDPQLAGTSCGRQYVLFGLRHGAFPH